MHFVLVHGSCHGRWCWYKLKPLLEGSGHKVTAIDLTASGINLNKIEDTKTFKDYTEPLLQLMASLPADDKVIVVGHSYGGMNLGLAMETYPEKIVVAVFLTAFLPDTTHPPSFILNQLPGLDKEFWLDTKYTVHGEKTEESFTTFLFGQKFISILYEFCPAEDIELATMLKRQSSFFVPDLSKTKYFTDEKFGSVRKAYIICKEDKVIAESFQLWMIENSGGVEVVEELEGSDHMPMFSMPQQLTDCLVGIAQHYSTVLHVNC